MPKIPSPVLVMDTRLWEQLQVRAVPLSSALAFLPCFLLCLCIPALFSPLPSLSSWLVGFSSPYSPFLPIYILQHLNFPSEIQTTYNPALCVKVLWKSWDPGKLQFISSLLPALVSVITCPCSLCLPHSLFITFILCCHPVQPNFLLSHHLNAFPPPFYVNSGLDFVRVTEMQLYCTVSLQHSETH